MSRLVGNRNDNKAVLVAQPQFEDLKPDVKTSYVTPRRVNESEENFRKRSLAHSLIYGTGLVKSCD